jgi:ADP-heptose:LPS heptosyltransferase
MRILFITSSRIGDAVIGSGILEQLRLQAAAPRITIACGAAAAPVFARLPGLERLIVFEKESFDAHWLKLWTKLATQVWDLVVDLRGSGLSLFLATKSRRILRGGRRPGRRYEQLAAGMAFSPAPLPVAWTSPEDEAKASALMGEGPVIALGPTATWDGKIWPAARFAAVYRELAVGMPGARAAIFGGPGAAELGRAAPLLEELPDALNFCGNLTLPEVAACLRRAAIFIGNDSGLMHIAAAAGAPTLGLFGRSLASEYAPAGRRTAVAIAPGPAGEAPMEALTVETVVAAARDLLCG